MALRLASRTAQRNLQHIAAPRSQYSRAWKPCRQFSYKHSLLKEKPFYVTTPIFYVNADPHVGHLFTLLLADIIKRWQLLGKKDAILCTGTDEHGMKVQQAAAKAHSEPKSFCDKGAGVFKDLAAQANVSYNRFIRTTDPDHREAVEYAWSMLEMRGYIYKKKHEGWYSVSDEAFYPASGVHLVLDPRTGRKIMASIETGKEVTWTSEDNYHFTLSAFQQPLLDHFEKNPSWISPKARMDDVVEAVKSGLNDLSISRPSERLSWGIPVPGDESQTIYVWLDALLNYITASGFPFNPGQEVDGGWPADCQVIGKDIVRFHCIYWPAFLMALDLKLPGQIFTHGHWTLGREKMAKSTGNVVNPFFALDRFGVDPMRFYLAHDAAIGRDADYSNHWIIERYKKDLQGGIGNLASRILRGKGWNVRRAVETIQPQTDTLLGDELSSDMLSGLRTLAADVDQHMQLYNIKLALHSIMKMIYQTNKYVQDASPWNIVPLGLDKTSTELSPDQQLSLDTIIYLSAESLRICGILLQPYMPEKSARLLDMLGVDPKNRFLEDAQLSRDADYGTSAVDLGRGAKGVLFPPLSSES